MRLDSASRIWIVTGSNMAGKSTFLRMVGVNSLLAQIGATPTARGMRLTPLRLISDLRARDNLAQSESYFLSEVRHLRRMIAPPAGDEPVLGLIDEPFRGTNSQDQTAASVAVVRHLLACGHLFLLATHDRHLTTLADGRAAANFHFRENLGSDGLVFDYKLHVGPATTRNALRILEHEGYPESLLHDAHAWLEQKHD
jgi:DNA mismatch repair ATPase MutS